LTYLAVPIIAAIASLALLLSPTPGMARAVPSPLAESYRFEIAGDLAQAIDATARAAQQAPNVYFLRLRLAYLKSRAKLYPEAAADYADAAKLAGGAAEPLLGELAALASIRNHERVIEVADALLRIDPKNYPARSQRAWALYESGRYAEASEAYASLLDLYPGDIEMRLGRAYSLSGARRPVEANLEFREVLKRMPHNPRARAALGLP
jgi:tetratricopeptide (TPR) repeat protein